MRMYVSLDRLTLITRFMARFVRDRVVKRMLITLRFSRMKISRAWADFRFKDLDKSVEEDVEFLKGSPLVLDVPISGYNVRFLTLMEYLLMRSMMSRLARLSKWFK